LSVLYRKSTYPEKNQLLLKNVGHISSLHPGKGFHYALSGWLKFASKKTIKYRLKVIGGIGLYGISENHKTLPVEANYGDLLLKIMKNKLDPSVVFMGKLSGKEISTEIKDWGAAIINPKGISESECMSMKECWEAGVPTISGNYFGLRDYMKDFPELRASSPKAIAKVLKKLETNQKLLTDLSKRSLYKYNQLVSRGEYSLKEWVNLIQEVLENGAKTSYKSGLPIGVVSVKDKIGLFRDSLLIFMLAARARIYTFIVNKRFVRDPSQVKPEILS
jgi:hypothetical protein